MPSHIITDVTRTVNAPIGQIWGIISAFGSEALWFPGVITASLEGYGIGSVRTLRYEENPWVNLVREELVTVDPVKHLVRFKVNNDQALEAGVIMSNLVLEDIDGKSTKFRWFAEADRLLEPSLQNNMREYVQEMYKRAIDAIGVKLTPRSTT